MTTTSEQRAIWKERAERYCERMFRHRPPVVTEWGPDGFTLRDQEGQQTAKLTWGEAKRNVYPNWKKKATKQKGAGSVSSRRSQTDYPAKKKPGKQARRKAKKQKRRKGK